MWHGKWALFGDFCSFVDVGLFFLGGVSKDPFKGVALHTTRVIYVQSEHGSSKVEA